MATLEQKAALPEKIDANRTGRQHQSFNSPSLAPVDAVLATFGWHSLPSGKLCRAAIGNRYAGRTAVNAFKMAVNDETGFPKI